jgi:hypothetical protein
MVEPERLNISNGDILVLRPEGNGGEAVEACVRSAEQLRRVLYARNIDDVTILILPRGADLDTLAESDMLAAGWVRRVTNGETRPGD